MVERFTVNGLEILAVDVPHVESLSVAFVVKAGSAHEEDELAGVSHFLEHVSFRGSKRYGMKDIKYTVESVGGVLNAFTGRTSTVYYFKVPDFKAKDAMDVMMDLVFNPKISRDDVEIERKIILHEYMMSREDPEDRLHDMALESVWGIPYGRPIIGRKETIESITREQIASFHEKAYVPERIKVIAVGRVDSVDFGRLDPARRKGVLNDPDEPRYAAEEGAYLTMRDLEHVHVLMTKECPGVRSDDYHKLLLVNTILGSGMSSYLFEEIREKEGLVYDISTEMYVLKGTGIFGIYFSTSPENVERTIEKIGKSLKNLRIDDYVDYGKGRFIGRMKMVKESPASLMWFYVDQVNLGSDRTPEDYVRIAEGLDVAELERFKEEWLYGSWAVFGVGPEGYELDTLKLEVG